MVRFRAVATATILSLLFSGCSWLIGGPSASGGGGVSWSLDNSYADAAGGNILASSGLSFDAGSKPFGSASLRVPPTAGAYAQSPTTLVDFSKSFTVGSRIQVPQTSTGPAQLLRLTNSNFEIGVSETSVAGTARPSLWLKSPTNSGSANGPSAETLTNPFTGGWDMVAVTYEATTHAVTIIFNNLETWSLTLSGTDIPGGAASVRISLEAGGVGTSNFADLFVVPGKALSTSEIETHFPATSPWTALQG